MVERKPSLFIVFSLVVTCLTLQACCKQQCGGDQCVTGDFPSCYFPSSPEENTGMPYLTLGGSVVMGGTCYRQDGIIQCGYIHRLEELTGVQVANFGIEGAAAYKEVLGYEGLEPFARVDDSVEYNPDATRVYLLIGGNDILDYLSGHPGDAPRPSAGCALNDNMMLALEAAAGFVRLIVERYQDYHGVSEVVLGSVPPVEEQSELCFGCKYLSQSICSNCHLCVNEILELWAFKLSDLADTLGGPGAGIYFADHYHLFPQDPSECSLYCDCVHLNCLGHGMMADYWHSAVP